MLRAGAEVLHREGVGRHDDTVERSHVGLSQSHCEGVLPGSGRGRSDLR